jgi:hypothetical protein
MKNLWATGPEELEEIELSETELLTLAFAKMLDEVGPFAKTNRQNRLDKILRWEQAQKDFIVALENEIARMQTTQSLERLISLYEGTSGITFDEKHPLHNLYTKRMDELEKEHPSQ